MDSEYVMMAYDENNKCLDEYLYDKTKELTMQYMEARENIISGKYDDVDESSFLFIGKFDGRKK